MARRGENIYKRKDGRWEGRFIKCYDENHKAKYASVYAHTYSEVKAKLNCAKKDFSGKYASANTDKRTLEEYSEKWLTSISGCIKQSTFVKYSNILKNHIIPVLGSFKISELTTEIVRSFSENKLSSGTSKTRVGFRVRQ